MSEHYTKVKTYYDKGLWNKARVGLAVVYNWITASEYETIVGTPYPIN